MRSSEDELQASNLPPLMDCSAFEGQTSTATAGGTSNVSHVSCFSDTVEEKNPDDQMADSFINQPLFPKDSVSDTLFSAQFVPNLESFNYLESTLMQDQPMMRFLFQNMKRESREFSTDTGMSHEMDQILSAGPGDLDCLWKYWIWFDDKIVESSSMNIGRKRGDFSLVIKLLVLLFISKKLFVH